MFRFKKNARTFLGQKYWPCTPWLPKSAKGDDDGDDKMQRIMTCYSDGDGDVDGDVVDDDEEEYEDEEEENHDCYHYYYCCCLSLLSLLSSLSILSSLSSLSSLLSVLLLLLSLC